MGGGGEFYVDIAFMNTFITNRQSCDLPTRKLSVRSASPRYLWVMRFFVPFNNKSHNVMEGEGNSSNNVGNLVLHVI